MSKLLPDVNVIGIEPVEALRAVGHTNGIPEGQLIDGDATKMQFGDGEFDIVSAFGILHHIPGARHAL